MAIPHSSSSSLLTNQNLILTLLSSVSSPVSSQKVNVSLYYETLCPYCANFIVNSLPKLFNGNLISIVDLMLVPWGNDVVRSDGSMVCQHGPDECLLNVIEACAIAIVPDTVKQFNFVYFVEWLMLRGRHGKWSRCLQSTGLGNAPIDCYYKGYGNQLQRRNAVETAGLNPRHRFVPWVVVDNLPLQEVTGLLNHGSVTMSSLPPNTSRAVISICFIARFPEFRELHMQGLSRWTVTIGLPEIVGQRYRFIHGGRQIQLSGFAT